MLRFTGHWGLHGFFYFVIENRETERMAVKVAVRRNETRILFRARPQRNTSVTL